MSSTKKQFNDLSLRTTKHEDPTAAVVSCGITYSYTTQCPILLTKPELCPTDRTVQIRTQGDLGARGRAEAAACDAAGVRAIRHHLPAGLRAARLDRARRAPAALARPARARHPQGPRVHHRPERWT